MVSHCDIGSQGVGIVVAPPASDLPILELSLGSQDRKRRNYGDADRGDRYETKRRWQEASNKIAGEKNKDRARE